MPLETYKKKRDFAKTPEPAGGAVGGKPSVGPATGRFVVQRHRATRLHYDFRLEVDGVLVSWAVPKGPTLDPKVRRMAVHVEDHPIEYLDFEGVIPSRQYGAGDVIIWDWGTFQADPETPNPGQAIEDGEVKFRLDGQKLKGNYTIVRTSRRPGAEPTRPFESDEGEQWLLIKKRDDGSVPGWDPEEHPKSVKTGRTNDEVKENRDALWLSDSPAAVAEVDLSEAREGPPSFVEPMLATLGDRPFNDEDWLFELKWDGYRVETVIKDGEARIYTRNGHDATTYFPRLLTPPTWIEAREAVVDGEVVALDENGRPDFGLLQLKISERTGGHVPGIRGRGPTAPTDGEHAPGSLVYIVFDLLHLDGRWLLRVPLEDRKRLLRSVLKDHPRVRFASHVVEDGVAFYRAAQERELEGILAKHRRSPYEAGRRVPTWLKIKLRPEHALVVGGWTPGEGNAKELGALVVGTYENGKLVYRGKVGSGFRAAVRGILRKRLEELATDTSPFDPPPERKGELRLARWVEPELVIRAELGGWSREGLVRQSAFKGIDAGREPKTVSREDPVDVRKAEKEAEASVEEAEDATEATNDKGSRPKRASGGRASKAPAAKTTTPKAKARSSAAKMRDEIDPKWHASTPEELKALDSISTEGTWKVGEEELKLTNLDKVLFPPHPDRPKDKPITKRELVRYFGLIAPSMLPHLADRALNLHRFPNGVGGPGFWQKDIPTSAPTWLRRWREVGVEEREANMHLLADRTAALCWLGNQAAFEVHAWTSKVHDPMRPTFALIDIDPGDKTTWEETLTLARLYRTALEHLSVRGYPKLTGKRGIQVWIPIVPKYGYDETSAWVEAVSRTVGRIVPDLVSWEWSVKDRRGRARLDYTQNTYIKTLVAPYAVRPAAGAPVSAPITWDELDDPDLRPNSWTIRNVIERVAKVGDLFAPAQTDEQELPRLG